MCEFRNVLSDVVTVLIKATALLDGIKDAVIRRCIGAGACRSLPAMSILGNIVINEMLSKETFTQLPFKVKVFD